MDLPRSLVGSGMPIKFIGKLIQGVKTENGVKWRI